MNLQKNQESTKEHNSKFQKLKFVVTSVSSCQYKFSNSTYLAKKKTRTAKILVFVNLMSTTSNVIVSVKVNAKKWFNWNSKTNSNSTDWLRKLDLLFQICPKDGATRKNEMELLATLFFFYVLFRPKNFVHPFPVISQKLCVV
jgi:hypothetical protein